MAVDLPALFGNPRMMPAAITPLAAALGLSYKDRLVDWMPVKAQLALVGGIILLNLVRQLAGDKPRKIWRGHPWPTFAIDVVLVVSSAFALTYTVRPWDDAYDGGGTVAILFGGGIAGILVCMLSGPAWVMLANRGEGPLKKFGPIGPIWGAMLVVLTCIVGGIYGLLGIIPLCLLWTGTFVRTETATLVSIGLVATAAAVVWASIDLRRHLAKQRGF